METYCRPSQYHSGKRLQDTEQTKSQFVPVIKMQDIY